MLKSLKTLVCSVFLFSVVIPIKAQKLVDPGGASTLHNLNCVLTVEGNYYTSIQSAVNAAGTNCVVIIPGSYTGVDTYTNTNNVTVIDYRHNVINFSSQATFPSILLTADPTSDSQVATKHYVDLGTQAASTYLLDTNSKIKTTYFSVSNLAGVGTLQNNTSGTASFANAFSVTPSPCIGSQFAQGITASGNAICGTPATPAGSVQQFQINNGSGGLGATLFGTDSTGNDILGVRNISASGMIKANTILPNSGGIVYINNSATGVGNAGFMFDTANQIWGGSFGTGGNFTIQADQTTSTMGGQIYLGGSARGDNAKGAVFLQYNSSPTFIVDGSAPSHNPGYVYIGAARGSTGSFSPVPARLTVGSADQFQVKDTGDVNTTGTVTAGFLSSTGGASLLPFHTWASGAVPTSGFAGLSMYSAVHGPGFSWGNSGGWQGEQNFTADYSVFPRGISQFDSGTIRCYKIGDCAGMYHYIWANGGLSALSDEGVTGTQSETSQLYPMSDTVATITTTTVGGQTVKNQLTLTNGSNIFDGSFLLDYSLPSIAGNLAGTGGLVGGSTYLRSLPISGTTLPITSSWCISNTVVAPTGQTADVEVPITLTCTLQQVGGVAQPMTTGFAVNAGFNYVEQTVITAVGAVSGGTQSVTFLYRAPQPGGVVTLFQGGPIGRYMTYDSQSVVSQGAYPIVGSLSGTDMIYAVSYRGGDDAWLSMPFEDGVAADNGAIHSGTIAAGGTGYVVNDVVTVTQTGASAGTFTVTSVGTGGVVTGIALNAAGSGYFSGSALATTGGTGTGLTLNITTWSGFHLYYGAEIVSTGANITPTLEPNNVNWSVGDSVKEPNYPFYGGSGAWFTFSQHTQAVDTKGLEIDLGGEGINQNATGFILRNQNGTGLTQPVGINMIGPWLNGLTVDKLSGCLVCATSLINSTTPTWETAVGMGGNVIQVQPSTGTWELNGGTGDLAIRNLYSTSVNTSFLSVSSSISSASLVSTGVNGVTAQSPSTSTFDTLDAGHMNVSNDLTVTTLNVGQNITHTRTVAFDYYTLSGLTSAFPCNSSNAGVVTRINDSTGSLSGGVVTGGSNLPQLVYCNGSNYVALDSTRALTVTDLPATITGEETPVIASGALTLGAFAQHTVTLNANVTSITWAAPTSAVTECVTFAHDATSTAYTVTWPSTVRGGFTPGATASDYNTQCFRGLPSAGIWLAITAGMTNQ